MAGKSYDVAVVGAGVFGAWTALSLAQRGQRVLLLEAYGPGHSRSSSGDESRIIRMGYGADEIYTRWSQRSLVAWKELFATTRNESLLQQTGVLWLAEIGNATLRSTKETLERCGVTFCEYDCSALASRYPQINLREIASAIFEPESGVLFGRRAVAATVAEAIRLGADYRPALALPPQTVGKISELKTATGESFSCAAVVFACGAWLGKLFPEILGDRIFPTRQTVFYFSLPPGDLRFSPPALPTFLFKTDESYGMPDLESRGLKIGLDQHGERVDPDTQSRIVTATEVEQVRNYVALRFPALANAPIAETRVCQYENTSSGDFLIDRHPGIENAWFAGGGSGHGFKHGPAVGEYVAARLLDRAPAEPRFSLSSKAKVQKRAVF